jgi:hypothetical protein
MKHRQIAPDIPWPEYYARAKEEAAMNPPAVPKHGNCKPVKLFGGALTPEYRAWYYRVQCACRALPTHQQNWPEFFKAAKDVELRRQGFMPSNIMALNPNPPLVPTSTTCNTTIEDGPLRFDFALPEDQEQ